MQVPILNGITADENSDLRTSYPLNLIPVPKEQGISRGYLRPADGVIEQGEGPGIGRGGINWNGHCYRIMGSKFVRIEESGDITELGDVGISNSQATFDYSFSYLGIAVNNLFFLWDGVTLKQVTDPDLGPVLDFVWVDGYFMTTDGENLVVTELSDPFSVNPLKYGSSEADPDPIKALLKVRNEPHALNRYTIEAFDNIGGVNFPFQRIDGAQVQRGTVGTHCCCIFLEGIAFLGGGRNEALAVWLAASGTSVKISTREIDQLLEGYTEEVLSNCLLEAKIAKGHQHLFLHLPDQTLVYDGASTQLLGEPVWFKLSTSLEGTGAYRARDFVWCYNKWLCVDPATFKHGYLTNTLSSHWGEIIGWQFDTTILYNKGMGALFHELELVCLTGRIDLGDEDSIATCYSLDGETWSITKFIRAGKSGRRNKRLVWLQQGNMKNWRIQRFKGTSKSKLSFARLEIRLEPLAV